MVELCLSNTCFQPARNKFTLMVLLGLKEFHEECLAVHNEYRLRHGAAPLQWSAELAWEAQQWAENLARSGELRHNDDDTVGENLAGMMGGELTGRETTDMWYEEIEDYDFDNSGYSEDTSNFTQVVSFSVYYIFQPVLSLKIISALWRDKNFI